MVVAEIAELCLFYFSRLYELADDEFVEQRDSDSIFQTAQRQE
jgi:hypothetical protein